MFKIGCVVKYFEDTSEWLQKKTQENYEKITNHINQCFLILIGLVCPLARGQDNPIGGEEWELSVTPYLWMAGIEGDVTIRGPTADIDLDFDSDKANIRERN